MDYIVTTAIKMRADVNPGHSSTVTGVLSFLLHFEINISLGR